MALSKTQSKRLGAILSVMFNEDAPVDALAEIIQDGYVEKDGESLKLTEKGNDERNRLSTLAGLNIRYRSEREAKEENKLSNQAQNLESKTLQIES